MLNFSCKHTQRIHSIYTVKTALTCYVSAPIALKFKEIAKKQEVSTSHLLERFVERTVEDNDLTYPMEELDRISKELDEDIKAGRAKVFNNAEEMFKELGV